MNAARHVPATLEDSVNSQQPVAPLPDAPRMEAIGRLVGGVAHDFNNLLTGMMLYCDLLLAGLPLAGSEDRKRLRHYVEEIRGASESGETLIRQLLAAVRHQPVECHPVSLNAVIQGTSNLLSRLVGENIKMATDLADDLGVVKMDPATRSRSFLTLFSTPATPCRKAVRSLSRPGIA